MVDWQCGVGMAIAILSLMLIESVMCSDLFSLVESTVVCIVDIKKYEKINIKRETVCPLLSLHGYVGEMLFSHRPTPMIRNGAITGRQDGGNGDR